MTIDLPCAAAEVASLLRLVASEQPLAAVRHQVTMMLAGAASAAEQRDVEQVVTRVWEMLRDRKHREQEIRALFDNANDLTESLRDTDELLDRIVGRAKERFDADACYLVLLHPECGEARMRVTAGSTGTAIGSAHLPASWGLVGVMKESGRPYSSANYLADTNLVHDASVDAAAIDEGIVAIAGAPLRLGEEMIGALFVASRTERTFSDFQLDLLGALANHAAMVLDNARQFEATRAALAELQAANLEIEGQARVLERASSMHERLTRLVLTGSDHKSLASTVAEAFDGDVIVLDAAGRERATCGLRSAAVLADHGIDLELLMAESRGVATVAATRIRPAHGQDPAVWMVPVRAGAEMLGGLVLSTSRPLGPADVRALERSAQTSAVLLLVERSVAQAEEKVRDELLDDLLGDRPPALETALRRARHLGLELDGPSVVLVVSCVSAHRRRLLELAGVAAATHGGIAGERNDDVVLVLPGTDPTLVGRAMHRELKCRLHAPITTGAAGPAESLRDLRHVHLEAARSVQVLIGLGRAGDVASTAELGVFGMLLDNTSDDRLNTFVRSALGALLDYDRTHGTDLIETLDAYFAARSVPRLAAEALHVHTNTVYQRLERVDALLAPANLRDAPTALELQLALKLWRLLPAAVSPPRR